MPVLYLIKGSRVREYHRQNVEILSAPEGEPFEVSYSARWVQTGVRPVENEGAILVFADSPYEHFAPIRFAIVEQVDDEQGRLTLRGRLGAFVCAEDRSVLDTRWAQRADDERPGRHRFLVSDDNPGFYAPNSPQAQEEAWRAAVDSLATNPFFETTTVIRATGIKVDGRDVECRHGLSVGDRAELDLELRSPHPFEDPLQPMLLSDPEGSMTLVGEPKLPATGHSKLSVDVVEPGPATVSLVLRDRTLSSTQVDFNVDVKAAAERTSPAVTGGVVPAAAGSAPTGGAGTVGAVDVIRLTRFLHRHAQIGHEHWLQLLDEQLLPLAPTNPVLLAHIAEHAAEVGQHERVVAALSAIEVLTPGQRVALLFSAVRRGPKDLVPGLLAATDLSEGDRFDQFLKALKEAPESTLHLVITEELNKRYLGDHLRTRLVQETWLRLTSIDLLCRAAEDVAYVDPDAGASLLLDRWPIPANMPEQAIDLLLDWSVRRDRLGPYVRARLTRASQSDDRPALEIAISGIDSVSTGDQPRLRLDAGLHMARTEHVLSARAGFKLAVDGFQGALQQGDIDLAVQALPELSAIAAGLGSEERGTVDGLLKLAEQSVVDSEDLRRWERMQSAKRSENLRDRTNGLRLIAVGGKPLEWFEQMAAELGLAGHRWIETDKDKSARHDWAENLSDRDIVLVVLPFIGHDSTSVKTKVLRQGAGYEIVQRNQMSVLDGIERALRSAETD